MQKYCNRKEKKLWGNSEGRISSWAKYLCLMLLPLQGGYAVAEDGQLSNLNVVLESQAGGVPALEAQTIEAVAISPYQVKAR